MAVSRWPESKRVKVSTIVTSLEKGGLTAASKGFCLLLYFQCLFLCSFYMNSIVYAILKQDKSVSAANNYFKLKIVYKTVRCNLFILIYFQINSL